MQFHQLADVHTKLPHNQEGEIDATFLMIIDHLPLKDTADGYKNFHHNQNGWTKFGLDSF
ncbi:threonine dehydrogenase-like Zn-dependent dehydrogenase [Devosia sp. UYZn731]|uniref:hypothetical protein n=1 Tax=Devosia sp. UYZn731 TaxID=3156345 RepID=UPI003391A798